MIVVRVELWSAISGKVTDLGTVCIDNTGVSQKGTRGDYRARSYRKGTWKRFGGYLHPRQAWALVRNTKPSRTGEVTNHPRKSAPIWSLVRKALESMDY
jgi:hypothetical protein